MHCNRDEDDDERQRGSGGHQLQESAYTPTARLPGCARRVDFVDDHRWHDFARLRDDDTGSTDGTAGVGVDHRAGCLRIRPARLRLELDLLGGRVHALQHVDDDDRDVVASTVRVGLGDELIGRGLWCVGGECDRRDLVVVDLVDQSIAAQDEPVAVHHRHQPRVDAHRRLDAERPRDDVAARMASRLVLGDVAGVDQFLHVAVIDGRPMELAVAQ